MDGNLTASDVALLTGNNRNDGMFGGDGAWWLIVLFLFAFCGWGNNGWGNNANCCCETREAIQGINYNMAQNTCALQNTMNSNTRDIIDSQNAGTRAILDYLCNEKISNLQAENNDLRRAASQDRQSALLTTAMASQTQQLINAINPAPIPAYQVPNPNTYYGCGCNTGCNC